MKKLPLFASTLFVFAGLLAQSTKAQVTDPRELAIYQIMTASFQHGEGGAPGYTAMWGPDDNTKNGNLRGIINALDYIKSLGVNAIWMTPIFDSEGLPEEKLQATGYFATDFFKIDPKFGTEEEFRELVDKAHSKGIAVILDGVFGHHGGVKNPSPQGNTIYAEWTLSDRGEQGGTGNVKYPESLPYFKEVATYWIDKYGIDGWRLDQAYQATQGGHNYWNEIRAAVDSVSQARRDRGETWGTLGYMVGEDWGNADVINRGVYRDGGLLSAFDFDGKERISGPMHNIKSAGLENGYDDIILTLSSPTARGYLNDEVMPNLFLTNHDGSRLADHFDESDPLYYEQMMLRNAILAAYSGPITLYYGDEFADTSKYTHGGQPDNVARTSGHLDARNEGEQRLKDYIAGAMEFRGVNPAMWRGEAQFEKVTTDGGEVLVVTKTDEPSGNKVRIVFSLTDTTLPLGSNTPVSVINGELNNGNNLTVSAMVPVFVLDTPAK